MFEFHSTIATYYASGPMTDSELGGNDKLKVDASEISSLQTKLEAAQQQISLLEGELQIKQRVIEELQPKGTYSACIQLFFTVYSTILLLLAMSQCMTKKHIAIQANYFIDIEPGKQELNVLTIDF